MRIDEERSHGCLYFIIADLHYTLGAVARNRQRIGVRRSARHSVGHAGRYLVRDNAILSERQSERRRAARRDRYYLRVQTERVPSGNDTAQTRAHADRDENSFEIWSCAQQFQGIGAD